MNMLYADKQELEDKLGLPLIHEFIWGLTPDQRRLLVKCLHWSDRLETELIEMLSGCKQNG